MLAEIRLAMRGRAQMLVTGDAAVRAVELERPRVLSPRDFVAALAQID